MSAARPSITERLLRGLARAVQSRPRWFVYPQILLAGLSVFYTIRHLQFSTDRNDLVGADKQYHRHFIEYKKHFKAEDEIVTVVESESAEKNRQFVERLGARLQAETNLFTDIIYNNDVKMLGRKALLFFPEPQLVELRDTLQSYRPVLDQFAHATNLHSLFRLINQRFRTAKREANAQNDALVQALPALRRIVEQATDALLRPGHPPSPGLTALFDAGAEAERAVYITFDNGRLYLVTARALSADLNGDAIARLRTLVEQTRAEVPGVNTAITGEPVLEIDEMSQSQRDSTLASVISLVIVALIFIYGYNESGRPIKATVCLVVGLAYTLAYATLTVGHLNILTITFVPMLIGLAIDFGVHLVTRYEEELRHGRTEGQAIETALVYTGQGIFTGAATTAGAFFAMGLTDFRGIKEMGIICGGGLLICLIPMLSLLPVWILRGRQNVLDHQLPPPSEALERIERVWLDRPWTVVGTTLALSAVCWYFGSRVGFDYNLLNLQTRGLPAVVYEQKLIRSAEKSVLYCAVITKSLEEALEVQAKLTNLPSVSSPESMTLYLTENQDRKLELIHQIKENLATLKFAPPDPAPVNVDDLSLTLWALQGYLTNATEVASAEGAETNVVRELAALLDRTTTLHRQMLAVPTEVCARKLAAYQQSLFSDIRETFDALRNQDDRERMRIEDLPPALRHRFVSLDGTRHLVQVFPRKDVWKRENQEEFVGELRRTLNPTGAEYPVITGTPVQLLEYTTLLKVSYEEAARYALGAIVLLVLIHFRSPTCVVLALLPVGIGTLWMLGFMALKGIPFNPANIMTLPLVIGIGVTNGVHILNRYAEERSPSILGKSTGKAVIVSGLTTIAGFGSLILGKHQGIASLGYVMAVGTGTCMLAALTLLPAVLNLLIRGGWTLKKGTQWRNHKLDTGLLGGTEVKTSI